MTLCDPPKNQRLTALSQNNCGNTCTVRITDLQVERCQELHQSSSNTNPSKPITGQPIRMRRCVDGIRLVDALSDRRNIVPPGLAVGRPLGRLDGTKSR